MCEEKSPKAEKGIFTVHCFLLPSTDLSLAGDGGVGGDLLALVVDLWSGASAR